MPDSSRPATIRCRSARAWSLPRRERLGVEFHRHRGGLAGQLVIPQPRRQAGQHLIGIRRISVSQAPGRPPDQPRPVFVDEPGGQRLAGMRVAGFQVGGQVHGVAGRVLRGDQFHAELGVGELSVPAAARHPARLSVLVLGVAAAGELRDRGQPQVLRPRGQPARGGHRADDLVVGQPVQAPGGLLGQRGQHRAGAHHVRGPVPREHLPAEPVRAQHRGQLGQVHVGGVTQADRRGRALDLPLLGDPGPARVQVGDIGGHLRVAVPVIRRQPGRRSVTRAGRRRAGGLVPRRTDGRRLLAVWPGTGERVLRHCATPFG